MTETVTIPAADVRLLMECASAARHLTDPVVTPLNDALRRCDDALAAEDGWRVPEPAASLTGRPVLDLLECAWNLMANAHASDEQAPPGWIDRTREWRGEYHAFLKGADVAQPDPEPHLPEGEQARDAPQDAPGGRDNDLHGNFDARVWAERFVKRVAGKPGIAADEETMLAWFAGALMTGYDHALERVGMENLAKEADASAKSPHLPEGEYAEVGILGHDSVTGWVTDGTRAGVPVMVVRDWDGREMAAATIGPNSQVVYLPTPLRRPEPRAAITASRDPWRDPDEDDDEPDLADDRDYPDSGRQPF